MQSHRTWKSVVTAAMFAAALPAGAFAGTNADGTPAAEVPAPDPAVHVVESDWSGPRIGFMASPGDARVSRRLHDHGLGDLVSLFGWHFEHQVTPVRGGPQLVTEMTPLFGGVEYGKVVPSLTFSIGLRSRTGYEVGMGPSFTLGDDRSAGGVGLVIAAGRSLQFGDVNLPLNLAVSTNPKGTMVSVLAGYAIPRLAR